MPLPADGATHALCQAPWLGHGFVAAAASGQLCMRISTVEFSALQSSPVGFLRCGNCHQGHSTPVIHAWQHFLLPTKAPVHVQTSRPLPSVAWRDLVESCRRLTATSRFITSACFPESKLPLRLKGQESNAPSDVREGGKARAASGSLQRSSKVNRSCSGRPWLLSSSRCNAEPYVEAA